MSGTSTTERRRARTRQVILNAARAIITEKGAEALSMRSLAEAVDYSPAALYNYFDSREAIIQAIRQEGWALSAAMSADIPQDIPLGEMMVQQGMAYLRFAETHPEHYRLMMSSSDNVPESLEAFVADPRFVGLIGFANQLIASGVLSLPEGFGAKHMAFLMWFVVHGASMLKLTTMRECRSDFDKLVEEVLRGLLKALES
jgi:AcrR family transcriptional regulator